MNKSVVGLSLIGIIVCFAHLLSCNDDEQSFSDENILEGYHLSQKYCGSCHLRPEPSSLNKLTWAEHILPRMSNTLGFRRFAADYISLSDSAEIVTLDQWRNIVRYYVSQAPENPIKRSDPSPAINMQLTQFKIEMPVTGIKNPATTMVLINPQRKEILFADGLTEYVYTLSASSAIDSLKVGVGTASLQIVDSGFNVLTMGVLYPSDARSGRLTTISNDMRKAAILIDSLQRPVHATYADLNGDSIKDIIMCEFGNTTGQLAWFEQIGKAKFTKHILKEAPGAVRTEVFDFNRDGLPDVMALMAQADEGFSIYYNGGDGKFSEERVLRLPPTHGSNYFELADFNVDGYPDIVASNGDNGDYPPILKAYHGIRIYVNNGKNQFSEKIFLPVNGAGKVIARDFDSDGDTDLASISYFPDYKQTPEESFVYWKNEGDLKFSPFSFSQSTSGRWLTMDANDCDGDGDLDIVLGNAKFTVGVLSAPLIKKWDAYSPSVLILRNTLH